MKNRLEISLREKGMIIVDREFTASKLKDISYLP